MPVCDALDALLDLVDAVMCECEPLHDPAETLSSVKDRLAMLCDTARDHGVVIPDEITDLRKQVDVWCSLRGTSPSYRFLDVLGDLTISVHHGGLCQVIESCQDVQNVQNDEYVIHAFFPEDVNDLSLEMSSTGELVRGD